LGVPLNTARVTTCALCGASDSYVDRRFFTPHRGYTLCNWCTSRPTQTIESRGHSVTLGGEGSWKCSCGETPVGVVLRLMVSGVKIAAMESVPHLDMATAVLHVQNPDWPRRG
jgi:hypothetical protein